MQHGNVRTGKSKVNTVGAIYCVGRNYSAHAHELNNPIPDEPVIFTKTAASLAPFEGDIHVPKQWGRCDYETELVVQLGRTIYQADEHQSLDSISHLGLALDLTLRDKQSVLKEKGLPWTLAKNFTNACVLSTFQPVQEGQQVDSLQFALDINNHRQQTADTRHMLFPVGVLLSFISQTIPLCAGDIVLTGTPSGVGELHHGDELIAYLEHKKIASARITR